MRRDRLESFADREGHPHSFVTRRFVASNQGMGTGAKQNMGTCEIYKIYHDDRISGYSTERPVPSVLRS